MKIYREIEQGSDEWFKLKLGKFSASDAQAIGANGAGLQTLVLEKVAEIITGARADSYMNLDMERGNELEYEGRGAYEIETGNQIEQVGWIERDEHSGCSPDGLFGVAGMTEFKCPNNKNFVKYLYDKKIDPKYMAQMQFQMLVYGCKWVDFVCYNPNFPNSLIITRVERDEKYIAKLKIGLNKGVELLNKILKEIK